MSEKPVPVSAPEPEDIKENNSLEVGLSNSLFFIGSCVLTIFLLWFVFQICTTYLRSYDTGLITLGSDLMLRGGTLYKDLHTVMFPGSYFLLYFVFLLFGSSQIVCNLYSVCTIFGVNILLLILSRKYLKGYEVFLPVALTVIFGSLFCSFVNHHWDSLFWILVYALGLNHLSFKSKTNWQTSFLTGICGGMAVLCYQNQALPVLAGLIAIFFVNLEFTDNRKEAFKKPARILAGVLTVLGVLSIYLLYTGTLNAMFDSTVGFVVERYQSVNKVAYGWSNCQSYFVGNSKLPFSFFAAIPYGVLKLAPFLVLSGLLLYRFRFGTIKNVVKANPRVFILFVLGLSIFVAELHKPDLKRIVFGEPILLICMFYLANQIKFKSAQILLRVFYLALAIGLVTNVQLIRTSYLGDSKLYQTRRGEVRSTLDLEILSKLDAITNPFEKVLIYPYDTGLSYLAAISYPGRFPTLQYRYHSKAQFQSVIDDMESSKVRFVVFNRAMNNQTFSITGFPTYEPVHLEDMIIEAYIKKKYEPIGHYGFYTLFKRK